jgi:hypothetical protein
MFAYFSFSGVGNLILAALSYDTGNDNGDKFITGYQ